MITTDAELKVVREQFTRVEAALESLRCEVKPKNETMYQLMAESYLDMLQSLRAEIDAYLGIGTPPENVSEKREAENRDLLPTDEKLCGEPILGMPESGHQPELT